MLRRFVPLSALAAALLLVPCAVAQDSPLGGTEGTRSWENTIELPVNDYDPVAVINGRPLTKADFVQRLAEWYGPQVLDEIITRVLVDQEMKRLGVSNTPEEVNLRIDLQVKLAEEELKQQSGGQMTLPDYLEGKGESLESFRQMLFHNENFQKQLILEKMVQHCIKTEEQIEVQHIVVDNEAKAREIHQQLHKGADFAALAQQHSDDQMSGSQGGKMVPFIRGLSTMGLAFDEAALKLKDGELSDVIHTQRGFHIIRRIGTRPANTASYSELKDEVWKSLVERPMNKRLVMSWLYRLRWDMKDKVEHKLKRK